MGIQVTDTLRRRVTSALSDHPVQFAYLFGSHVHGHTHAESDVDVAVFFDPAMGRSDMVDAQCEIISPIAKSLRVSEDVVNITRLNDAHHMLRLTVAREGIVVFTKDHSAHIEYELRVLQEEDDQRSYRRAYNDAFLRRLANKSA